MTSVLPQKLTLRPQLLDISCQSQSQSWNSDTSNTSFSARKRCHPELHRPSTWHQVWSQCGSSTRKLSPVSQGCSRRLTASSLIGDEHATVIVGQGGEAKEFRIPKALLCARSSWFASALEGDRFIEGTTRVIRLPDDSPEAFEAFQYYIYHKDLAFREIDESTDVPTQVQCNFRVWVFGDKYNMTGLQNCIMLRICELLLHQPVLPDSTLAFAVQNTVPFSPLRNVVVDYLVDQVLRKDKSIRDFTGCGALEGIASELFEAQREFHKNDGVGFPRYHKLYKNSVLFKAANAGSDIDQATCNDRASEDYWRLDCGLDAPTCEECGINGAYISCKDCGGSTLNCKQCGSDEGKFRCNGCNL